MPKFTESGQLMVNADEEIHGKYDRNGRLMVSFGDGSDGAVAPGGGGAALIWARTVCWFKLQGAYSIGDTVLTIDSAVGLMVGDRVIIDNTTVATITAINLVEDTAFVNNPDMITISPGLTAATADQDYGVYAPLNRDDDRIQLPEANYSQLHLYYVFDMVSTSGTARSSGYGQGHWWAPNVSQYTMIGDRGSWQGSADVKGSSPFTIARVAFNQNIQYSFDIRYDDYSKLLFYRRVQPQGGTLLQPRMYHLIVTGG